MENLYHYCPISIPSNIIVFRNKTNAKFDILLLLYITMNTQRPHNNKIPRYRQLPFSISGSSENCIKTKISIHFISVFRFDMT